MRTISRPDAPAFAILILTLLAPGIGAADAWPVRFDVMDDHHPQGWREIYDSSLQWNLWPSTSKQGGSEILNSTGIDIVAIHVKVDKDDHPDDRFLVDATSGGSLFTEIWKKTDDHGITEVIFIGGPVLNGRSFWSLVPQTGGSRFWGLASSQPLPHPSAEGWTKVTSKLAEKTPVLWKDLIAACPPEYRNIKVYGDSAHGDTVCFVSRNRLLRFDKVTKTVRPILSKEEIGGEVNRITLAEGAEETFVLWWNGVEVARLPSAKMRLGEPLSGLQKAKR
jgi:hypothetical protein